MVVQNLCIINGCLQWILNYDLYCFVAISDQGIGQGIKAVIVEYIIFPTSFHGGQVEMLDPVHCWTRTSTV